MRVALGLLTLMMLAGCDTPQTSSDQIANDTVRAITAVGGSFDYRYAYKVPGNQLKPVVEQHAGACDKLGPARCKILSMRYRVDDANRVAATLTLRIDPLAARDFGNRATQHVVGNGGALVETELAGSDATTSARSNALVSRLREQLANAQSSDAPIHQARARRIQTALEVITESEGELGGSMATAPVLITYASGTPSPGLNGSASAGFRDAGDRLVQSAAAIAQVLAGVGPWLLLMIAAALILRILIHGSSAPRSDAEEDSDAEADSAGKGRDRRAGNGPGAIRNWFSREVVDNS